MKITEKSTGEYKDVLIQLLEKKDLAQITSDRFSFDWKKIMKHNEVYKLILSTDNTILGLISLEYYPSEERIEMKLLEVSRQNIGKNGLYDGIAGCMIAFAGRTALAMYGQYACISLIPKTALKNHYIKKYGMIDAGWQLFLELGPLNIIVAKYTI
ncbi:MAG: hypothetical protein J7623_12470 [Chitinophaga sp.]|uniref:hypothetical protein n=1 Tax=Chitinophaga sp. TaxID=1869181 RepID=UPI001B105673|nr:hypothetical protein [Chitinophaga sp.]MBO9729442.1 hypothetical protein [Chitinophaga sp.]